MGWGTAVIYVGQQAWEGTADAAPADSGRAVATPIVCSRTLLTAAQGRAEADSAIARAAADGFPRGSVIYLDVEPMSAIPPAMRDYYRAWAGRVLAEGRYRPGVYVHHRNAAAILADMRQVYRDAGAMMGSGSSGIPLWVARQDPGFSVLRAPGESSVEGTRVWQGRINVDESWNGVTLRIDANVADVASPSAPMGGAAPGTR